MAGAEIPHTGEIGLDPKSPDSWPDSSFHSSLLAPEVPGQTPCSAFPDGEAESPPKTLSPWLIAEG